MLKKMLSVALAAAMMVGFGACSNQAGLENPLQETPSPGFVESEATPAPTEAPTPGAPQTPEDVEIAAIEGLLEDLHFRDMDPSELAGFAEQLGEEYDIVGRTDGAGNAYALIRLADGRPFSAENYGYMPDPAGDYRYIAYEISHADDTREIQVALLKKDADGTEREEPLYAVQDVENIGFYPGGQMGYVILEAADREVAYAVMPGYRNVMIEAARRGLLSLEPAGAHLRLYVYDKEIKESCGFYQSLELFLPLTAEQEQQVKALVAAGFEQPGDLLKKYPGTYDTQMSLALDGERYALFSNDAFSLDSEDGYFPKYRSAGLSDWVREIAGRKLGYDPAGYEKSWFDQPLASATLEFHVYTGTEGMDSWAEQVQTVTQPEKLERLAKLFKNAEFESASGCPFGAQLVVTRADGETLTIYVAEDSCGMAMAWGSIPLNYGKQDALAEIFDEAMAGRD